MLSTDVRFQAELCVVGLYWEGGGILMYKRCMRDRHQSLVYPVKPGFKLIGSWHDLDVRIFSGKGEVEKLD